ncbi:MAG: phosphoadenosine phosphosulfate reductase, partial [Rhizobiaceae bacterium]
MEPTPRLADTAANEADIATAHAARLEALHGGLDPRGVFEQALAHEFGGHIAAVASFGAVSAVRLHLCASV